MESHGDSPTFYANGARIRTTVYDVTIQFRWATPIAGVHDDPKAFEDKAMCTVSMSPAHALSVLRMLERHLNEYQSVHGKLPDALKSA